MSTAKQYVECLRVRLEGMESHSSIDPGGHTVYGFAKKTREHLGLPDNMTAQQADDAYIRHWWMPRGCDAMPPIIGWLVCDAFVNHSTKSAALIVQKALGNVAVDGAYGPATMQACINYPNVKIFMERYAFFRRQHFARRSGVLITRYTRQVDRAADQEAREKAQAKLDKAITQEHGWQNRLDKLLSGMWEAGLIKRTPSKTAEIAKTTTAAVVTGAAVAVGTGADTTIMDAVGKAVELAANGDLTTVGVTTWVAGMVTNKILKGARWLPKIFSRG